MGEVKLKRILFIPDIHAPYQDQRALNLACKAARTFKPHHTFVLGDVLDNYSISTYDKDPGRKLSLAWEAGEARKCLEQISNSVTGKKYFIEGNHEVRLCKYMYKIPELNDMLTIPRLLELKENGWTYVPYKESVRIGKLSVTHDFGSAGRTAHTQASTKFGTNVVIGHVHSMGITYTGNITGERHVGACFGWLGDVNRIDYMHRDSAKIQWQLGFGVGFMEPSGHVHLQACPIVNYRTVVNGRLIVG